MSKRVQKFLLWLFGGLVFLLVLVAIALFAATGSGLAPLIIDLLFAIGYFVARKVVENMAANRAEKFSKHLNALFKEFNAEHNPTANWKLTWRTVIDSYNVSMTSLDGSIDGKITPNYAEQAEITLEIHDSLSDLTTYTISLISRSVRVKEIMSGPNQNQAMTTGYNQNQALTAGYNQNQGRTSPNHNYTDTNNLDRYHNV